MPYDFELSALIPAAPKEVYDAWLSSEGHTAMTGGKAQVDPVVGGTFVAWDGYVTGTTLELDPPRRIVQSWRTTNFSDDDPDSRIEVLLEPAGEGTKLTILHTNVPSEHRGYEDGGWKKSYFDPMQDHFSTT